MSRRAAAAVAGLVISTLTACGGDDADTLQVLAASSLTDVFTRLAEAFEEDHEDVEVELSFGSSTDLAEQAADGAPGAVLATADETTMAIASDADAANPPTAFAGNVLVLVTRPGNPAGVASLSDLEEVTWVRCADEVPCGRSAVELLSSAGVDVRPDSLEEDARTTLDKVVAGEADAALVYRTDALAVDDAVETIPVPEASSVPSSYYVATLRQAPDGDLAEAFVELVLGETGVQVLREAGFTTP
ncbi:molybdate ABC transporter substrate-binding protein [Nocardioides bizhenqiangii]|uniref:Molybdate ABC transporter substrate-binding protein n=1 Tax=Nocardioides bizhenqiangii TaxID=3095076 RepID=A0ABZ0ZNJ3_9ACTN|nr:molybdate ABC transporter substrate-binding protein [Nocardioides sp. HM61]WQQ25788.1 molybdate ABC transporter substrate-binding protein [Nocardioides sp. HM61]